MGNTSKTFALMLILMMTISCMSLLTIKPANAQTIPQPSVPEFTLNFADKSYDTQPTTSATIDPYNGKTTTTTIPSYHITNYTIELTITNQAFPTTIDGNASNLYYDVRMKGHFEENWTDLYPYSYVKFYELSPTQSNYNYTVISFPANDYRTGDQVDFQVQAILGYEYSYYSPDHAWPVWERAFNGVASDWSPTQTFTMPNTSITPSNALIDTIVVVLSAIVVLIVALAIVILIRHRKNPQKPIENRLPSTTASQTNLCQQVPVNQLPRNGVC
jgi:hypothetical protein